MLDKIDQGLCKRLDSHGDTYIHIIVKRDYSELITQLIGLNIPIHLNDKLGKKPLHIAAELKLYMMINVIVQCALPETLKDNKKLLPSCYINKDDSYWRVLQDYEAGLYG